MLVWTPKEVVKIDRLAKMLDGLGFSFLDHSKPVPILDCVEVEHYYWNKATRVGIVVAVRIRSERNEEEKKRQHFAQLAARPVCLNANAVPWYRSGFSTVSPEAAFRQVWALAQANGWKPLDNATVNVALKAARPVIGAPALRDLIARGPKNVEPPPLP